MTYKRASRDTFGKDNYVINLDVTANRFYPVRVYDAKGKLKYTVDARGMKIRSEQQLEGGNHWRKTRSFSTQ